jgi:ElaB/YqjD/DUF883 family membrane-anchored ribosome-binding protein
MTLSTMELYYKDLISDDASLEKLVDNLILVVQGAEAFAEAAGAHLAAAPKEEINTGLNRLKQGCAELKQQAFTSALAVNKLVRQYPYTALGFAFVVGLLIGASRTRNRLPIAPDC